MVDQCGNVHSQKVSKKITIAIRPFKEPKTSTHSPTQDSEKTKGEDKKTRINNPIKHPLALHTLAVQIGTIEVDV